MKSSLAVRLLLLSLVTIALTLGTTALVLNSLFYNYFEDRIYSELNQYLKQVTANILIDDDGNVQVKDLPDPRFNLPFSGLYWQVTEQGHPDVLSRSLWGRAIDMPVAGQPGQEIRAAVNSYGGVPLLALGWTILLGDPPDQRTVNLSVAIDQSEVISAASRFRTTFLQWLSLIFLALVLASWMQVRLGLAPLESIRRKVELVRSGISKRLAGPFPREVQPLANEVNELLDLHETSLESARARASDLAHGLKTPLTVMLTLARDLRAKGQNETAQEIEEQVESMRHYIERELARTRTRPPSGQGAPAGKVVHKMVAAIRKFPRETPLEWHVDIPGDLVTPFDEHDLSELLGNTLDNARKWARHQVFVRGYHKDGESCLEVSDDGPGVPENMYQAVLTRGERLDPRVQGQGLGLAICVDLAESCGAGIALSRSDHGGLSVKICWPAKN